MRILAGEAEGDIALRIADQDETITLLEVHADNGQLVLGKTYAQTLIDEGIVYGVDNQLSGSGSEDFNSQLGTYRIAGVDVVVPTGGTAGQILEKIDATDYNMQWATPGGGGGGLDNDVLQMRRTTPLQLTTAFVDVTMDATDEETDPAVIEHNGGSTDNADIKVTGVYRVTWSAEIRVETSSNSTITMDGRVRVNNSGSGAPGSFASSGAFNDSSIAGEDVHGFVSKQFDVSLTAGDFLTLQVEKVEISGSQDYDARNAQMNIERIL